MKKKYKLILLEKQEENNINIISYCIMDNHIHLLLNVNNIENMCKFMHQINTKYAKFYNKVNNRVGYVFRNRYFSKEILDYNQLKRCIVYIHRNPVVAKIVKNEKDYKYSSYNEYLESKERKKLIDFEYCKKLFGEISEEEFIVLFKQIHKYKDSELKEFDNFNQKQEVNFQSLIEKYKNFSQSEKIIKLNKEEKISERKLAKIFNQNRYQIRKILKNSNK